MSPETKINQANLDLLFKNHPLPMWIYDIQSLTFLEVNDAAVKKYGYSQKKFLSMTLKDIRPKEDVVRLLKDVSKKRPALQQSHNWRHKLKSGKIIDVEITSHTIKYNGRKAVLVTAKDITDQKRAEEKINKLNRVYAVLSDVNQTIVRTKNAKELFKDVCRIAVEKGGFAMAWIGMLDKNDNKVKVASSAGVTKDYLKKINIDLNDKKRGGGPTGLAVKTGKHVISNIIEKDKRMLPWKKDATKYGYRSSASFPIKVLGKVIGSFSLYSSQELFFDDEEIKLLDEMVMDLSFALEFIEEEREKREAEEKLKLTQFGIDHSQIAVYQIDDKGNIHYANEQACNSLGYTYDELTSMSVLDIDPTFSLKKWRAHRKNIRKKGSGIIETIHKRKDGTEFFVEVSIDFIDYDDKNLSFSFAKDITKRKLAEEALYAKQNKLRLIFETMTEGIVIINSKEEFIQCNSAALSILSLTEDQLMGRTATDPKWKSFREDGTDFPFEEQPAIVALRTGKEMSGVIHLELSNGNHRWINVNAVPYNSNGNSIDVEPIERNVLVTFSDITESQHAEETLKESEIKFRTVVEEAVEIVFTNDTKGYFTYVNPAGIKSSGYSLDELKKIKYIDLIEPEFKQRVKLNYFKQYAEKNPLSTIEYPFRTKSGEIKWFNQNARLIIENDEVKGFYVIARDVTERRIAEEALQKNEAELQVILESTADGILAVDQNGKVIKTNKRFVELWQIPAAILNSGDDEELLNFVIDQLIDPEQFLNKVRQLYNSMAEDLDTLSFKDGRVFERFSTPFIIENKISGRVWSFRDITKRKSMELALQKSKTELEEYFQNDISADYVTSLEGEIFSCNETFLKFFGFEGKSGAKKFNITQLYQNPDDRKELIRKIIENKKVENYEVNFISKDGKILNTVLNAIGIFNNSGELIKTRGYIVDITERKLAEKKLLESEKKFRSVWEKSTDEMRITNEEGIVILVNDAYCKLVEKPKDEVVERPMSVIQDKTRQTEILLKHKERFHSRNVPGYLEKKITLWNGDEKYLELSNTFLEIANQPALLLTVFRDVSERKRTEETLRESEERFRNLVENINEVFYITDKEGRIRYCSPNFTTVTGFTLKEISGNSYLRLIAPIDRRMVINHYLEQTTKGVSDTQLIFRVRGKDGKIIWVEQITNIVRDTSGSVVEYRNVTRDITDRKQSEEALRESKQVIEGIINTIPVRVFWKDKNLVYLGCNTVFARDAGFADPKELIGKDDYQMGWRDQAELYRSDDRLVIESGRSKLLIEEAQTTPEGKTITLLTSKIPLRDSKGEITGLLGTYIDITERRQVEEKLRESEEQLRVTMEVTKIGIWDWDVKNDIWHASPTFYTMLGYEPDPGHANREAWLKRVHPDDVAEVDEKIRSVLNGTNSEYQYEARMKHADGSYRWHNVIGHTVGLDEAGKPANLIGVRIDITERKLAEEELRKSKEELQKFFEDDLSANYISTPSGHLLNCNKTFLNIFGFKSKEEALAFPIEKLFPVPSDRNRFIELIKKNKKVESFEGELVSLDGRIIYTLENTIAEFDNANELIQIRGYIVDITKRKKAEEELKKLSRAVEQSPTSVVITNQDGDIEYVNKKFCQVTGYSKEDVLGKNPRILKSGYHDKIFYDKFWNHILSGKDWKGEMRNKKKNGELYWESVLISPLINKEGDITHFVAVKEDITERKKAEEEIVLLANALKSVSECVSITDIEDKIIFVNQSFAKTYGYSEAELIGKHISNFRSPNNPQKLVDEILPSTLRGGWQGELWNERKDGSKFLIYLSTRVINDKDGKPFGLIGIASDITERKAAEKELIKAKELADQSNKLKDAFIANMSHEIRTPLNGILGLTSIIKDMYAEHMKEGDEELFAGIDHSSKRIIRTVDMILNYSRIQTGEFPVSPRKIELSSICENLVKEFTTAAKSKLLELSFENKCGKTTTIFGDEYSITHAISNLMDNAIKYTSKGFIDVILYNGKNDELLLDIKDSGIGISEDYIQHIYEPYTQEQIGYGRAYQGVGLGLSMVKKFLNLNNANISVERKKGKGTTFTINFEKSLQRSAGKIIEEKIDRIIGKPVTQNKLLVLIVEDDVFNQITIKRFIEDSYNTINSDSSEGAIELLKDNKVDLILMDISIKGSKNGLELTEELKASKEYSHIPVVAITAHAFDKDRQNALEAGCDDYLSKPFSKSLFLDTIGKFV